MPKTTRDLTIEDLLLMDLIWAIVNDDRRQVTRLITRSPSLVQRPLKAGATRKAATDFYIEEIHHYLYAGDTPLHAAAAGYREGIARELIKRGADVKAANRRRTQPLHYASDGVPGSRHWNPQAQAGVIAVLINAGADPDALDKSGVAPLHRAVRQRCAAAVDSLLRNGSSVRLKNKSGSTPLHLAVQNTGRGGTGSDQSKALQKQILRLLLNAGADLKDRDGRGKTVRQCVQSDWISDFLLAGS